MEGIARGLVAGKSERDEMLAKALRSLACGDDLETSARKSGIPRVELESRLRILAEAIGTEAECGTGAVVFYVDGASRGNPGPAGAGIVRLSEGKVVDEKTRYLGETTNNVAEYRAVELALSEAVKLGLKNVEIRMDSELVYHQLTGRYKIKDKKLIDLYLKISKIRDRIEQLEFRHVPRRENLADRVANLAIDTAQGRVQSKRKGGK
jgi:ribonuclease HI